MLKRVLNKPHIKNMQPPHLRQNETAQMEGGDGGHVAATGRIVGPVCAYASAREMLSHRGLSTRKNTVSVLLPRPALCQAGTARGVANRYPLASTDTHILSRTAQLPQAEKNIQAHWILRQCACLLCFAGYSFSGGFSDSKTLISGSGAAAYISSVSCCAFCKMVMASV